MSNFKQADFQTSALWAKALIRNGGYCILDTETTGLGSDAQIVQIAVIDQDDRILFDSLVCPTCPIEADVSAIHGLRLGDVAHAPTFEDLLIPLLKAIGRRDVIIYNAEYDLRLLRQSAKAFGIHLAFPTSDRRQCRVWIGGGSVQCAMLPFSAWCGEWNEYRGNYKWQKLPGGDHTALGDCRATAQVIRRMAASYEPVEPVSQEYDPIDF